MMINRRICESRLGSVRSHSALLVATRTFAIAQSRLPLIKAIQEAGLRCIVLASPDGSADRVEAAGAQIIPVSFDRQRSIGRTDVSALRTISVAVQHEDPVILHAFHLKPILLSAVAARRRRDLSVVATVTGVGNAAGLLSRPPLRQLVGSALGRLDAVIFQNPDDRALFRSRGWADEHCDHLILGSGVDTARYAPDSDRRSGGPAVLFAGRLLWSKGLGEFIEASRALRSSNPEVRFLVAGEFDHDHADAVPREAIATAEREGLIEYLGFVDDMPRLLRSIDAMILPSYYPEGLPRIGLEAAACGIPVIAADAPGTRETVVDGVTGHLVAPRSTKALVDALEPLLADPEQRRSMGDAARQWVCEHHDLDVITAAQLRVYSSVGVGADRWVDS
jgi:glycosyltransferase involved in cell wall biosynthesis